MIIGNILIAVFILGWCVLLFIVVRNGLKANNIFTKNPYANRGNGPPLKTDNQVWKFIYFFALAGCLDIWGMFNYNGVTFSGYVFFNRSWFFLTAGVINAIVNRQDNSFDIHPYLRYTMKLWFSLVFLPTVLLTVSYAIANGVKKGEDVCYMYARFVVYAHGLSMPALAVLILIIRYIAETTWSLHKKRIRTLIAAEVIVSATLAIIQSQNLFNINWALTWLAYLLITGISVLYYEFEELVSFDN